MGAAGPATGQRPARPAVGTPAIPSGQTLLGVVGSRGDLAVNPDPLSLQPQQIKPGGRGGHEPRPGVQAPLSTGCGPKAVPPSRRWVAGDHGCGRHSRPCDWGTSFSERPPGPGPGHTHACQRVNRAGRTPLPSQGRGQSPVYSPVRHPGYHPSSRLGQGGWDRPGGGAGPVLGPPARLLWGAEMAPAQASLSGKDLSSLLTGHLLDPPGTRWCGTTEVCA